MQKCAILVATSSSLRGYSQIASLKSSRLHPRLYLSFSTQKETSSPGSVTNDGVLKRRYSTLQFLAGGALLGTVFLGVYQAGYVDKYVKKRPQGFPAKEGNSNLNASYQGNNVQSINSKEQMERPSGQELSQLTSPVNVANENAYLKKDSQQVTDAANVNANSNNVVGQHEIGDQETSAEAANSRSDSKASSFPESLPTDNSDEAGFLSNGSSVVKGATAQPEYNTRYSDEIAHEHPSENEAQSSNSDSSGWFDTDKQEGVMEIPVSISNTYLLQDEHHRAKNSTDGNTCSGDHVLKEKEAGHPREKYVSEDGNIILDFLEAIHAAERKQAERDAARFAEEKKIMKDKYEKELKDSRAQQLLYAEEAAILEELLEKEKTNAEATIRFHQEKADEKLKVELQRKDKESDLQLKKVQELAKAELGAALLKEKSSHLEKVAEADRHINSLSMAFLARSEEIRQSHLGHKLALGSLALANALSKGLPIQAEVESICNSIQNIEKDSLLALVLLSIPKEALESGSSTPLELRSKLDSLANILRHFSLIPTGQGGMLTHAVASIASSLKIKENDISGEGIESVIRQVEVLLSQGKLVEAADALERGVCGSGAEEAAADWVMHARNRAIVEQAFTMLESYATLLNFA